jgi:hypothetical protein
MDIRLIIKLRNDKQNSKNYISKIHVSNPKLHDYEIPSYTYFSNCEVAIGRVFFEGKKEETFAYELLKDCKGILRLASLEKKSLSAKALKSKSEPSIESVGSYELPDAKTKNAIFSINLHPNDYSNFLVSLNAAESLAVDFCFYKEEETKIEELSKLILKTKITRAKLTKLGNPIDAGRTTIYLR